jgi:epoxyqueuosine reductase
MARAWASTARISAAVYNPGGVVMRGSIDASAMSSPCLDPAALAAEIKAWGVSLGFQRLGIARADLSAEEPRLQAWLDAGMHGAMHYMDLHGVKRARPAELIPGTVTVISGRIDYLPPEDQDPRALLDDGEHAYIARYSLGRDYHKLMRRRMQQLADRIEGLIGPFGYRVFADTGPVLERPLARNAGLGWVGKHTLLIDKDAGSFFFLGELFTDLPLPPDAPHTADHCGSCTACMTVCPTQAIVQPYQLDARRCISYLTIEEPGSIPVEFRKAIGNRIYGCDDCQLFCPWNKFAVTTRERDFDPRHGLDTARLIDLFAWSEAEFLSRMEGSAIWRLGHERWLRNLAVALGNSPWTSEVSAALEARRDHPSALVREHVAWALAQA